MGRWLVRGTILSAVVGLAVVACSADDAVSPDDNQPSAGKGGEPRGGDGGSAGADAAGGGGDGGSRAGSGGDEPIGGTDVTGGTGGTEASGGAGGGGAGGGGAGESGAAGSAGEASEKAGDGFLTSANGWTITGDAQADSVEPDFFGVGGNPDGLISATDDVTGGVWYFTAPSKYFGDASAFYGKWLRYDLEVTEITSPFDSPDVELSGGGLVIVYDTSPDPGTTWTSYAVPLSEAGWKLASLTGADVTAEQFSQVLSDVTALRIRGEFNTGSDTGKLDNVKFGSD